MFKSFILLFAFAGFALGDEIDTKLEKVLYPVVRVTNGQGGGSGTVVYSEDREKTGEFQTFVFTNHHVIANLIHVKKIWDNLTTSYRYEEDNDLADVELFNYTNGGRTVTKTPLKADIIAYIADEDIALLKLRHPFQVPYVARLLPQGKQVRLFQEIYAVGCPLLEDPLFTLGQVTGLTKLIDGRPYLSGTAQIIWGNSGGAVMAQVEGEWYFIGIPSRGAVAQNGQMVTYMAFYCPPERLLKFCTTQKLLFLVDPAMTPTAALAERAKMHKASEGGPEASAKDY